MSYDLHIAQTTGKLTNFSFTGLAVDQVRKAVSQWVVFLMTKRGSVLSDTTYGTSLLSNLQKAGANDLKTVTSVFNLAVQETFAWMATNNQNEASEIIVGATLKNLESTEDKIILTIELVSRDGTSYILTTPTEII